MEGIDYSEKIVHSTVHTIGVRTLLGGGRENTVLTYLPTYTSGLLVYCTTTSTHTFPPIHVCIVSNLNISTLNYLPLLNQLSTLNSEHSHTRTLAHSLLSRSTLQSRHSLDTMFASMYCVLCMWSMPGCAGMWSIYEWVRGIVHAVDESKKRVKGRRPCNHRFTVCSPWPRG